MFCSLSNQCSGGLGILEQHQTVLYVRLYPKNNMDMQKNHRVNKSGLNGSAKQYRCRQEDLKQAPCEPVLKLAI